MELETRRLREIGREISALKERHGSLAALVDEKDGQLDATRKFLPPILEQDEFIDELYRTADFYRARLASVQSGEIISTDAAQAQVVTVKVEADYISLMNFIRETLDGERLANLEKFSVTRASGEILSCELSFKIFAESAPEQKERS